MDGCYPSSSRNTLNERLLGNGLYGASLYGGVKSGALPALYDTDPRVCSALRSRSVGAGSLCDTMTQCTPSQSRKAYRTLQRQHRSFDGMELLEDCNTNEWPLATSAGSAPLSNATSNHLWKQPVNGSLYANEYELLKREYEGAVHKLNSTMSSIKTFWSPELKRERQLRKEESAKVTALQRHLSQGNDNASDLRIVQLEGHLESSQLELMKKDETIRRLVERGGGPSSAAGSRLAQLETRCNQLESLVSIRDQQLRSLEQQLAHQPFAGAQHDSVKDRRIADLEEELSRRDVPRDFTDKSVTAHELHTVRMKMERSEMELAQKSNELTATQTRLHTASEENEDLRKHLAVLRDSSCAKEQHATLLQSDIEALRAKLEAKNSQLEQKEKLREQLESEVTQSKGQLADMRESSKSAEQRMTQLVARLDALESLLREREQELDKTKHKLLAQPDVQMERQLQLHLDEANREKTRLQSLIDELRRNAEKEKSEQLDTFQEQNRQLSSTIESLQKELSDRQILLESQNEKIGDLDRELCSAERQCKDLPNQTSHDEQLAEARNEIESLLRMVQSLDKDKSSLLSQCKQMQSALEEVHKEGTTSTTTHRTETLSLTSNGSLKSRVEELEEALRESVSITAERELHVAQQKQLNQQLALQLSESRREVCELRKLLNELSSGDREEMVRSFDAERRKHLEQLLALKHEALVAAIGEKDAHIALLEQSQERPRDEIDTLRSHKDKLLDKLKIENERRVQLVNGTAVNVTAGAPVHQAALPSFASTATEQEDDAEGIWA